MPLEYARPNFGVCYMHGGFASLNRRCRLQRITQYQSDKVIPRILEVSYPNKTDNWKCVREGSTTSIYRGPQGFANLTMMTCS